MTNKQIYKEAARRIAEGESNFSCNAVSVSVPLEVFEETQHRLIQDYERIFKPNQKDSDGIWFGLEIYEENQLARSLALLFMAEMETK